MKEKKILFALRGLSIYERNRLSKYIHSPYFNVNPHIADYFDLVEKDVREGIADEQENESYWKLVYDNEPYNNQKFLKLNSDLLALVENFLAQEEYEQMPSLRACHKIAGAGKRNLNKLYNGILGDIYRLERSELNQSSEFYLNKYQIEKNIFNLKSENEKKNVKFEIDTELNIQNISENLDIFYIAEKLKQYCSLLSWKKMYKLDIDLVNMENVMVLAKSKKYSLIPSIEIFHTILLTYQDENNTDHYYNLKNQIKQFIHLFPKSEQSDIFSTIISYCVNKVNKNIHEFNKETFELYVEALKLEILIKDNILPITDFRNIVPTALRVNEFEWTENFIKDYAPYLDPRYRDNAVEFSMARLEFYRKEFGKVLDHLNKVNYEDVWYSLNAKTLQMAAYYELDEFDALESLLQAYKMYIKREKSITQERKTHYLNLIKFTSSLIKINQRDQPKVLKLKDDITKTKGIVSKPWLLEKVEEMIRK